MTPENTVIFAGKIFEQRRIRKVPPAETNFAAIERQKTIELLKLNCSRSSIMFRESIHFPPDEVISKVTEARLKLQSLGFENFDQSILPNKRVTKHHTFIKNLDGIAPPIDFFDNIDNKIYPYDASTLSRGVYLMDRTVKPDTNSNPNHYIKDNAMELFLGQDKIKNKILVSRKKDGVDDREINRLNLSPNEIECIVINELYNSLLGQHSSKYTLRLPRFIEFNMICNLSALDLGKDNTEEWFGGESTKGFGVTFVGGKSIDQVRAEWKHHRSPTIGFRPIIFIPY